jgi:hypothetical protein
MNPQDLYLRFWHGGGSVGPNACPMKSTPHYQAAVEFLRGAHSGLGYIRYCQYINWASQWDPTHSPQVYSQLLFRWKQGGFNVSEFPIKVYPRNEITYIVDGAHRCAFALALNYEQVPVVFAPEPEEWNWSKNVHCVESIELVVSPSVLGSIH